MFILCCRLFESKYRTLTELLLYSQSCPWVTFSWPDPTRPTEVWTRPDPPTTLLSDAAAAADCLITLSLSELTIFRTANNAYTAQAEVNWRGHKKRDGGTRYERDCWYYATVCSRSISTTLASCCVHVRWRQCQHCVVVVNASLYVNCQCVYSNKKLSFLSIGLL